MQLAVEADFVEHLGTVAFHAAVVVVQGNAGHVADQSVENPAGPNLVPGIVPDAFPAADYVETASQDGQEAGYLSGVVLQIGIQGDDLFAVGRVKPGRQGRRLAEIPPKANAVDLRVPPRTARR